MAPLWERIVGRPAPRAAAPGDRPVVWIALDDTQAVPAPAPGGMPQALADAVRRALPRAQVVTSHPAVGETRPGVVPGGGADVQDWIATFAATRPAVLAVVCGRTLPAGLLAAAARLEIPRVVLAAEGLAAGAGQRRFWRLGQPVPLTEAARVFVPDPRAREAAVVQGAAPERVIVTGRIIPPARPPGAAEAERAILAEALAGRPIWLAAAVPEAEEEAVIEAHRAALGHAHRAVLILAPADPRRAPALAARVEAAGWEAASRSHEDPLHRDVAVVIADDPGEYGLWYRLASLTYIGGTISSEADAARDPLEAASLGSALVHGPHVDRHPSFAALEAASATRRVADAAGLAAAIDALLAPDQAANLASAAWAVSTSGAALAQRIAQTLASLLPR